MATRKPKLSVRQLAISKGFRSGLEDVISQQLDTAGVSYSYEEEKLTYEVPAKVCKYTPDFKLENGIYIETKGIWDLKDRQKMKLIKDQHPDKDIRIVFQSSKTKISKNSKTTYGMWADKLGYKWADKRIPQEWLDEPAKD